MEEDIQKIIAQNAPSNSDASIKIASHMTEFIEWLMEDSRECGFEKETFELKPVWYRIDEDKDYSIEEMYQYWKENIKTK